MPARTVEIPVAFPDRREMIVKIAPTSNVLDLKRAIAREEAKEVLAAGSNADLLGKRYTAPATFRLILRGMELNNTGTLEYYHLTTKGRAQLAIRVCPKHDSLVSEDDILGEDFSVPETVAHLEEEEEQKRKEEEEARKAAKLRHATFHRSKKGGGSNNKGTGSAAGSTQNSPSRRSLSRSRPDSGMANTNPDSLAGGGPSSRPDSAMGNMRNENNNIHAMMRSYAATPEPGMPPQHQQPVNGRRFSSQSNQSGSQQQHQHHSAGGRHHLPPMPENVTQPLNLYSNQHHNHSLNNSLAHNHNNNQYGTGHAHTVTASPTRGLAPQTPSAAAIFALPLDGMHDYANGDGSNNGNGGSPDILSKMKSYLKAAEKGEAPLPQVLPLPGVSGGNLTPPRGARLAAMSTNSPQRGFGGGGGGCPQGVGCPNAQKLAAANQRIEQLEAAVDRYKQLLHRLTQIENSGEGGGSTQQQQQQSSQQ